MNGEHPPLCALISILSIPGTQIFSNTGSKPFCDVVESGR